MALRPRVPLSAGLHSDSPAALAHETGLIEASKAAGLSLFQLPFYHGLAHMSPKPRLVQGWELGTRGVYSVFNTEKRTERAERVNQRWKDGRICG